MKYNVCGVKSISGHQMSTPWHFLFVPSLLSYMISLVTGEPLLKRLDGKILTAGTVSCVCWFHLCVDMKSLWMLLELPNFSCVEENCKTSMRSGKKHDKALSAFARVGNTPRS